MSVCLHYSRHHFRVTVTNQSTTSTTASSPAHVSTYLITSGHASQPGNDNELTDADDDDTDQFTADQLLTASTMQWQRAADDAVHDDDGGGGSGQRLVVSSGGPDMHSERRMQDGRMVVVNEKDGVRATSWFERTNTASQQAHREEEERKQKLRDDRTSEAI